jgi:predicted AAA+ superfamily ATPase
MAKLDDREANKKYYFVDNGILNLFLFDGDTSLLENQVAIHLRFLYGEEVYFLQGKTEVDFYLPETQMAVQVCYSLHDAETRKREINSLIESSKRLEIKRYIIITKDDEELISQSGIEIHVIPVWKWLL